MSICTNHDVIRADVTMDDTLLMNLMQYRQQRSQQLICLRPWYALIFIPLNILRQCFTRNILHHNIHRVVLQERTEKAHYVGHGSQFKHCPAFLERTSSAFLELFHDALTDRLHAYCIRLPHSCFAWKVLLDRNYMIQHQVSPYIRNTKSTSAKTFAC